MAQFTAEQAINAGLLTELMTVVTDEEITPTKFTGSYKVERKENSFGYRFIIDQDYLNAKSISGTFESTEEIMKFGEEMKSAGVTVNFVDDVSGNVIKLTADEAIKRDLIFYVRDGLTSLQGSFEVTEGVATFKQKAFLVKSNPDSTTDLKINAVFTNIDELAKMIEKFLWLDSLKPAERA